MGISIPVWTLSTQAYSSPITFNLRGLEIEGIDESATMDVTVGGLTATLTANDGVLNQTSDGFGINASGRGDKTYLIDNGSSVTEFVIIIFDQLVTFDQLVLTRFTSIDEASLTIADFSLILLGDTGSSPDIYNFSSDNTIPVGQSVMLAYGIGNGFSFDEFTVTLAESTSVPEPTTLVLLIIGMAGLGGGFLRKRSGRQTEQ